MLFRSLASGNGTNSITVDAASTWVSGNISVTATNATCNVASNATVKNITKTGCRLADGELETDLTVFTAFPVPAHEEVIIKFDSEDEAEFKMDLYDLRGQLIKSKTETSTPGKNLFVMDVRTLQSGIYMMHILGANGQKGIAKVIVE